MKERPPAVAGLVTARPLTDGPRIIGWYFTGLAHGLRRTRSTFRARAFCGFMLLCSALLVVPLLIVSPLMVSSRRARFYMPPERDAVLGITARSTSWHIADHSTARPGTQRGHALRTALIPQLLPLADTRGVRVTTTAATAKLAETYAMEVPGLVIVGMAWPRGFKMAREPRQPQLTN